MLQKIPLEAPEGQAYAEHVRRSINRYVKLAEYPRSGTDGPSLPRPRTGLPPVQSALTRTRIEQIRAVLARPDPRTLRRPPPAG